MSRMLAVLLSVLLASVVAAHSARGQLMGPSEWQAVPGGMQTAWAAKVDPAAPLPEHPRPQLVRDTPWMNLNGLWQYAITDAGAGTPKIWDGSILVPFAIESALSGVGRPVGPSQALWYRTTFEAPTSGERFMLHFGAVDWEATIFVNGRMLGQHRGGYTPFSFDVTDAFVPGGEQELVVRVWDPNDTSTQPAGKQSLRPRSIWYTAVTGIWQTVWLEPVPTAHITRVVPRVDLSGPAVEVTVEMNEPLAPGMTVHVFAPHEGAEAVGDASTPIALALNRATSGELWTPENPKLYDLVVELHHDGRVIDRVGSYFALRSIGIMPDSRGVPRVHLNGRELFQFGPLDQGWWPDGLYTAPTDEALAFDIEVTRRMGFNMARKHVKVEPARWYYHADRLGLLVWQDFPSTGSAWAPANVQPGQARDADLDELTRLNFRRELADMITALEPFPCIIAWVPLNEGWGQHDTNQTLAWVKQRDPSRITAGPSGWEDRGSGDWKDMHSYPGPDMFPVMADRASVLGEFGGLGLPVRGHTWIDEGNWGYRSYTTQAELEDAYTKLIDRLELLVADGLAAAVYTQTTDVEREVNGLLTYDRAVEKIPVDRLASLHDRLYTAAARFGRRTTLLHTAETRPETWRYTTTAPPEGWAQPGFDDSAWSTGAGGFGTPSTPNTRVQTLWDTPGIWLRRTLTLPDLAGARLALRVFHDEDTRVFLNGTEVFTATGWLTGYSTVLLDERASAALRAGENTLAVQTIQRSGGQYIDVGLIAIEPADPGR